ncbi:hypothetical protein [Celeribacter sp.]|uniref:hypothetical protein n=1 Tax=Celeribacter sp. TaxID=1890673 RepID=UPI003A93B95B
MSTRLFGLPGQIASARFCGPSLASPPSSRAWRLLIALIAHAGAEAGADTAHVIALDDLRDGQGVHFKTAPDLLDLISELRSATMTRDGGQGAFGLLEWASVLMHDGSRFLRWRFTDQVRSAFACPDGWAEMDRQALRALPGRYAMQLYSLVALHRSAKRYQSIYTLDQLRARLGFPDGTLSAPCSLLAAIRRTIADVNREAGLKISLRPIRHQRQIEAVELSWRGVPAFKRSAGRLGRP